MKLRKKHAGIETLKSRYAYIFVAPWIIGLILFFAYPLIQSILYSFSDVSVGLGSMKTKFIGLENFRYVLREDPKFTDNLAAGLGKLCYSIPIILVLSLVIGIMLNSKFRGRLFFRAVYFLPVIIASGPIIKLLFMYQSGNITGQAQEEVVAGTMIDAGTLVSLTGLPSQIGGYISMALSGIMNIVWNCGIQIVLFIAGMQTIPDLLYEVAKVEGATKWEEFWFITFPSLAQVIILVMLYTVVETMTSQTDVVMTQAYTFMQSHNYGNASAMLWLYFLFIGAVTAFALWAFQRFCVRRWE